MKCKLDMKFMLNLTTSKPAFKRLEWKFYYILCTTAVTTKPNQGFHQINVKKNYGQIDT